MIFILAQLKILIFIKISKDSFLNVYFNFIYNWMTPYVTDIEDKVANCLMFYIELH